MKHSTACLSVAGGTNDDDCICTPAWKALQRDGLIPPMPFEGVRYMRADGCAYGGYAACRESDEGASPVVPLVKVR